MPASISSSSTMLNESRMFDVPRPSGIEERAGHDGDAVVRGAPRELGGVARHA